MKNLLLSTVLAVGMMGANVVADVAYDYNSVVAIVAKTEKGPIAYAKFPAFVEIRQLIADAMAREKLPARNYPDFVYEMRLACPDGLKTIFVGKEWITDGEVAAPLDAAAFESIDRLIKERLHGKGDQIGNKDAYIDEFLVSYLIRHTGYRPSED